jgi:cytidine deaminase
VGGDRRQGVERLVGRASVGRASVGRASVGRASVGRASLGPPGALLDAARQARLRAVAPFSRFLVGAALQTVDGTVVTGCNVENATYGLTICAERLAVFKALSDGHREFARIAIVADTVDPTPPCGACRQILWEFCGNIEVILADLSAERGRHPLLSLLPLPFDRGLFRRA